MHLQLKNIGQINDADIRFGDLTVFVGPQATGKTIALEFLKLAVDLDGIQETMSRYGLDWSGELRDFFGVYFGEGMQGLWQDGLKRGFDGEGDPCAPELVAEAVPKAQGWNRSFTSPLSEYSLYATVGLSHSRPTRPVFHLSFGSSARTSGNSWDSSKLAGHCSQRRGG